ncbi:MAG: tRNA lysidine(34) synthetase TilS [Methyloprofundus sp.]|nr:tRNA lysidine(34) synthetase TilS [Methyloprofundus sp.]
MIGYSGGVDSHVLLHLLADLNEFKGKITAVYIHHGLQDCADDWAEHCAQVAADLSVNFKVIHVNALAAKGQSPEEAARDARYQAFKEILTDQDVLLFAQHRNDQLETVLLQLFRGTGLKGLSGMPAAIAFAKGQLVRPLLEVNQQAILDYAQQHHLQWIEDPSNQSMQFDRNYLRHQVIPLIEQRWPSVDATVARVAKHSAEAQSLIAKTAQAQMLALYQAETQSLAIPALLQHEFLNQQWIIREWLAYLAKRMPTQKIMQAILNEVLLAQADANPVVQHDGDRIQRYRDALYLVPQQVKFDLQQVIIWQDKNSPLSLPNNQQLIAVEAQQGIAKHFWQQGRVEVRYRQGGEKIALFNRTGRHSLKKLYQEAGIAPWLRDAMPLLYIDDQLAAIAGYWVSADFYAQDEVCISFELMTRQ